MVKCRMLRISMKWKGHAMKILLTATVQSHICQFHRPLVEMLHEHGCEVDVAARDNLAEKNGLKLDFADHVFDVPFSRSPLGKSNRAAYKQLKEIINNGDYDIIHCNTPVGGVLTRRAASRRKKGTKVFYTAHGFHFYKGAPLKNWLLYYPVEKFFSRKTDDLITIVDEDYRFAQAHFRCPVSRIHGVGVDNVRFSVLSRDEIRDKRVQMGYDPDANLILCVGELLPNKNQKLAISAMPAILKEHPNTKLLIAGNGPEKENLERLIDSLNLKGHVELLGYRTDISDFHQISDLLVACSIREGLSISVIEAMMCAKPVVLTENRGHRELIDGGNNGFMVPVTDCEGISTHVCELLDNEEKYLTFSHNAYAFSQRYSKARVREELREIYGL